MDTISNVTNYSTSEQNISRSEIANLIRDCPIPNDQLLDNVGLFISPKMLSRILFLNEIFQQIRNVPGIIVEFGTRFGPNLSIFSSLRGVFDPFNRHRKIVGFDTFTGFPEIHSKDGKAELMKQSQLTCPDGYYNYLNKIMQFQEIESPLSHIKKYELIAGDATKTFPAYLDRNPQTIVSLVYFDFDIYQPTKTCIELIKPRLTKGSIVAFDELNDEDSPGETLAVMETFGLNNIRLVRPTYASRVSYFVVE